MSDKEALDKHFRYVVSCEENVADLSKKFGWVRSGELLLAVILVFMYFFNRDWAIHVIFGAVVWLLLTNRNCFFGDWLFSLINLREAEIRYKIVNDKVKTKSDE